MLVLLASANVVTLRTPTELA